MRTKTILIAVVLSLVVIFAGLFLASENQNFLFAKAIGVGEFQNLGEDRYVANITDGRTILNKIYINIDSLPHDPGNIRKYRVYIQVPYGNAELDSVTFRFHSNPNPLFSLYTKASSYVWNEISLHQENSGYVYRVNDLGYYGKYAVNFEFITELFPNANHLTIEADLSMHQPTPLQLTSLIAHVFLDAKIPVDI